MLFKTVLEKPLRKPLKCWTLLKTAEATEKRKVAKTACIYSRLDAPGPEITWSVGGKVTRLGRGGNLRRGERRIASLRISDSEDHRINA